MTVCLILKNHLNEPAPRLESMILGIHDLRHTFASWLVMDGVPLYDVSKLLRHSNIRMTEKYAHLAPDHLQKAIAGRGFSAHFQHTNLLKAVVAKTGKNQKMVGATGIEL